ncbi:glycosyltransferase family 2 protein [Pectobacterium carotovorum]|uniref:glycosyltransferase family 2 protein n=1 Tax=Pectobacterium carotovorum TaxID=554 RepID=UPI0032EE1128
MSIYIAVVSHGHEKIINEINCLHELCKEYKVILKSNIKGDDFSVLQAHENFHWINEQYSCGFGHNNNIIFNYCLEKFKIKESDIFIVLNPDVDISIDKIAELAEYMKKDGAKISAINLFKDKEQKNYDNSIRHFPTLKKFILSFLGYNSSYIIDKNTLNKYYPIAVDWAAGSFLAFTVSHYANLKGFDQKYFMYCEDIDICYRSNHLLQEPVIYYPQIIGYHFAKHENRKIISKHFAWHILSISRFLLTKVSMTKPKSCINIAK